MTLQGKRLLLLGGSNSTEDIRRFADENGVTLIATAPPRFGLTALKAIADESYDADAVDEHALAALIKDAHIDGVFPGNNEDVMPHAIAAAEMAGLPIYCDGRMWDDCANKAKFKAMCRSAGIPVARTYDPARPESVEYPVAVKPADSCGSQGFSICRTPEELTPAMQKALPFSRTGTVLIEEYIPYDSSIIHYTLCGGEAMFGGISDKRSMLLGAGGGSVMALQQFPSAWTERYLATLDEKVRAMFRAAGMHDGPVWIEAFNDRGRFIFNEMGYRFGGSMTYHPVRYFTGVDQLELMLRYALGDKPDPKKHVSLIRRDRPAGKRYGILPLHIRPGVIQSVSGEEAVQSLPQVYAYVPIHRAGDTIRATGTVSQVFCYLHLLYDDMADLAAGVDQVTSLLRAEDDKGENMIFQLYRFS